MLKPMPTEPEKKTEPEVQNEIPKGYYYVDTLPSRYRCYPKGTKIYTRPLKVLELKHLATMTEETADMVINDVLKNSVIGINYEDLVIADKIFIIMFQRANTYRGDEFSIPFTCPECGHKGKYSFDISMVSIDDVDEEYSLEKAYEIGEHLVQIDQPRIRDLNKTKTLLAERSDVDLDILTTIAYRLWKIDGKEVSLGEAYDFVVDMNPGDFVKLNGICAKTEMKILPVVEVKCESCGKEVPVRVSFRSDFFIPPYRG